MDRIIQASLVVASLRCSMRLTQLAAECPIWIIVWEKSCISLVREGSIILNHTSFIVIALSSRLCYTGTYQPDGSSPHDESTTAGNTQRITALFLPQCVSCVRAAVRARKGCRLWRRFGRAPVPSDSIALRFPAPWVAGTTSHAEAHRHPTTLPYVRKGEL